MCKELEAAVASARTRIARLFFMYLENFHNEVLLFVLEKRLALVRDALMVISTDRLSN